MIGNLKSKIAYADKIVAEKTIGYEKYNMLEKSLGKEKIDMMLEDYQKNQGDLEKKKVKLKEQKYGR